MENSYIVRKENTPMFRGIRVKTLQITLIVTFIVTIFLFSGLVSALDSNALSAYPVLSKDTLSAGYTVTVRITLQSNTDEQLQIQGIGINFDWMLSDGFYGPDLSSNPVTIQSNGTYTSAPFTIQIPSNASAGSHTYYVGVDGLEGTAETSFSWNSPTATIQVFTANVSTPTQTPSPTESGDGQTGSSQNLLLYGAIVAIAAVIVVSVIVMLMRKNRKQATPVADQPVKPVEGQS